ncbi:MAG TPA: VWA domain-containing protein [Ktedonobacteraceae bacterium]
MKICRECGTANTDGATFCVECAYAFTLPAAVPSMKPMFSAPAKGGVSLGADDLAASIRGHRGLTQAGRSADVLFVLDCTGSMQGEIDAIKSSIIDFANTIESDGVRVRVGLIEFRDRLHGEEARVLTFEGGSPFTSKAALFRQALASVRAHGGGDAPESSLDALMLALRQPFASETNKVIVLITDAPPHIPDKEIRSIEQVTTALRNAGIAQFYLVMRTEDAASQIYLKLLETTRGLAFELGKGNDFRSRAEHFKRTLMALGKTISEGTR